MKNNKNKNAQEVKKKPKRRPIKKSEQLANKIQVESTNKENVVNQSVFKTLTNKINTIDSNDSYLSMFLDNNIIASVPRPGCLFGATHCFNAQARSRITVSASGHCMYVFQPLSVSQFWPTSLSAPSYYMNDPTFNPIDGSFGILSQPSFWDLGQIGTTGFNIPTEFMLSTTNHAQLEITITGFSRLNAAGKLHICTFDDNSNFYGIANNGIGTIAPTYCINNMQKQPSYKFVDLVNNSNISKLVLNYAPITTFPGRDLRLNSLVLGTNSGVDDVPSGKLVVIAESLPSTAIIEINAIIKTEHCVFPNAKFKYPTRYTTNYSLPLKIHNQLNAQNDWKTQIIN